MVYQKPCDLKWLLEIAVWHAGIHGEDTKLYWNIKKKFYNPQKWKLNFLNHNMLTQEGAAQGTLPAQQHLSSHSVKQMVNSTTLSLRGVNNVNSNTFLFRFCFFDRIIWSAPVWFRNSGGERNRAFSWSPPAGESDQVAGKAARQTWWSQMCNEGTLGLSDWDP